MLKTYIFYNDYNMVIKGFTRAISCAENSNHTVKYKKYIDK